MVQFCNIGRIGLLAMMAIVTASGCATTSVAGTAAVRSAAPADDRYSYPVTEERTPAKFRQLAESGQLIEETQVPVGVARSMSTYGLLRSVLDWPMIGIYPAYGTEAQPRRLVRDTANNCIALAEFLRRNDAPDALQRLDREQPTLTHEAASFLAVLKRGMSPQPPEGDIGDLPRPVGGGESLPTQ